MTKLKELATSFLERSKARQVAVSHGPINAFSSLFSIQALDESSEKRIEGLLTCHLGQEGGKEADVRELKRLTQEVTAIQKQEMILIGERLAEARRIFKNYKEGGFRQWLEITCGSWKTGYNYLSFFDLYTLLPEELKNLFKGMPAKAAYVLASKNVPLEKKAEIVKESSHQTASSLIAKIQEMGEPLREKSGSVAKKTLELLKKQTLQLRSLENPLSEEGRQELMEIIRLLQELYLTS